MHYKLYTQGLNLDKYLALNMALGGGLMTKKQVKYFIKHKESLLIKMDKKAIKINVAEALSNITIQQEMDREFDENLSGELLDVEEDFEDNFSQGEADLREREEYFKI